MVLILITSALERFLDNGLLGLMMVAGVAPVLDPGRDELSLKQEVVLTQGLKLCS